MIASHNLPIPPWTYTYLKSLKTELKVFLNFFNNSRFADLFKFTEIIHQEKLCFMRSVKVEFLEYIDDLINIFLPSSLFSLSSSLATV